MHPEATANQSIRAGATGAPVRTIDSWWISCRCPLSPGPSNAGFPDVQDGVTPVFMPSRNGAGTQRLRYSCHQEWQQEMLGHLTVPGIVQQDELEGAHRCFALHRESPDARQVSRGSGRVTCMGLIPFCLINRKQDRSNVRHCV